MIPRSYYYYKKKWKDFYRTDRAPHEPDWEDIKEISVDTFYLIKFIIEKSAEYMYVNTIIFFEDLFFIIYEIPVYKDRTPIQWFRTWYYHLWWWGVWELCFYLFFWIFLYYGYKFLKFFWNYIDFNRIVNFEFTIFFKKHLWDICYNFWLFTSCLEFLLFFLIFTVAFRIIYSVPYKRYKSMYTGFRKKINRKIKRGIKKFRREYDTRYFWKNFQICPPYDHSLAGWFQNVKNWDILQHFWIGEKFDFLESFYLRIENYLEKIIKFFNEDIYSDEFFEKYYKYFKLCKILYSILMMGFYLLKINFIILKKYFKWYVFNIYKIMLFIYFEFWWEYFTIFAIFFESFINDLIELVFKFIFYCYEAFIIFPLCIFFNKDEELIHATMMELFALLIIIMKYLKWYLMKLKYYLELLHYNIICAIIFIREVHIPWIWRYFLPWLIFEYGRDLFWKIYIYILAKYRKNRFLALRNRKYTIFLFSFFPIYDLWIIISITENFITYGHFSLIKYVYKEKYDEFFYFLKKLFITILLYIFFWIRFIVATYVTTNIISAIFWGIIAIW